MIFKSRLQKKIITSLIQIVIIVCLSVYGTKGISNYMHDKKEEHQQNIEYQKVEVDPCDLRGKREANAVVDIGYDSDYAKRGYYAYTNETRQLIKVTADKIILQNDDEENEGNKRYCSDEANVKGTKDPDLDKGHVIADSLGGVSNAYNITPQDKYLNRKGKQYQMEQVVRDGMGAENFKAEINYPNVFTMIPSSYHITFAVNGQKYNYEFKNEGS